MEKCRRMKRQRCMSKNWINSWLWTSSKIRQQYCRLESFVMKTDIPTNGSMVKKPHLHSKRDSDTLQHGEFRSLSGSRFVKFVLCFFINFEGIFETGEFHHFLNLQHVKFRFENEKIGLTFSWLGVKFGWWWSGRVDDYEGTDTPKFIRKETTIELGDPLFSEILGWSQGFRDNLVDDEIPVYGDSLHFFKKPSEDLCKHNVYHFAESNYSFDALQTYCFGINIKL